MVAAHNVQSTGKMKQSSPGSPKQARKKKGSYHCGAKGHWENECKKRIVEERASGNGNGTVTGTVGGAAIHSAALVIVANTAIVQKLLSESKETLWIFDSGANRQMFPHRKEFLEYSPMANSANNVVGIGSNSLRVAGVGTVRLYDETGGFSILQDVLHVPELKNGLLSVTRATDQGFETLIAGGIFASLPPLLMGWLPHRLVMHTHKRMLQSMALTSTFGMNALLMQRWRRSLSSLLVGML